MSTLEKFCEIMSSHVHLVLSSPKKEDLQKDLDSAVKTLLDFEKKYSRFIPNNELDLLNNSAQKVVSPELFDLLHLCQEYYEKTNHLFDPTIYNALLSEGYVLSKKQNYFDKNSENIFLDTPVDFSRVTLQDDGTVTKPLDLKIDLGGIGKGYIVDQLSHVFKKKYRDFCVNVGGDLFVYGKDLKQNYDYWAVEIENPFEEAFETPTLILSNLAVATSGVNKRKWLKDGKAKTHLIDPRTKKSVESDLVCVTVVGPTTVFCDIMAKTLVLLGLQQGNNYCKINNISAVFISKNKEIHLTKGVKKYVWKE